MKNNQIASKKEVLFVNAATMGNYPIRNVSVASEIWDFAEAKGLAIVSVYGGLGNGLYEGWTSYSLITAAIEQAVQNKKIKGIILNINSPGGMAQGLLECCDYIKKCTEEKPIYAYIHSEACSAAYAIATACTKVFSARDAETGCCGCYAECFDYSEEAIKEMGLLHRIFRSKNAPKKNQSVITDEEAAKEFQSSVDMWGDRYLELVATNRGVDVKEAEEAFGKGAVVSCEYALANKMIDGICAYEDVIALFDNPEVLDNPEALGNSDNANVSGSLSVENEGEDMDIKKMSAEERKTLFSELTALDPSLLEERDSATKTAERKRIENLAARKNGFAEVDELINAAIEDGRSVNDIALDLFDATAKHSAQVSEQAKADALKALADNTQAVNVPSAKSDEDVLNSIIDNINKERSNE